jgi:NAD(P)-dependent dehydrogenase (short-subunit alcohol dehydrogenase family)
MAGSQGKVVAITGAAAGIGRALVERFASSGWRVGAFDVNEAGLAELVAMPWGAQVHAGLLDVSKAEQWAQQLADFTAKTGGQLDVLVNNAGISVTELFEKADVQRHARLVDINLKGVINGCHAALPYLRRTPGARVVNMCSASALYGQPMLSSYSASKAAVRSLSESLDIEWRSHGVRVVDLMPLFVDTPMVARDVRHMKTVQALGVRLSADDIARAVWRLARMAPARLPVHSPVGWQGHVFYALARLSPTAINKRVTALMAGF